MALATVPDGMATYLDTILAAHRAAARAASADGPAPVDLIERAAAQPPARGFRAALERAGAGPLAVISEIKRRSPSKGDLHVGLDPARLAASYERAGATCLSVLTDETFFGGSVADLQAARAVTNLPVLRKDFTVCERDVCDARLMGADCVLLIAAALAPDELIRFHRLAVTIGLDVLVEVHDEAELATALAAGSALVGVNQRDLATFRVDHERAVRMAGRMPAGVVRVAESGVRDAADAASLRAAGYHAILVGESLVTSPDPEATLRALRVG